MEVAFSFTLAVVGRCRLERENADPIHPALDCTEAPTLISFGRDSSEVFSEGDGSSKSGRIVRMLNQFCVW